MIVDQNILYTHILNIYYIYMFIQYDKLIILIMKSRFMFNSEEVKFIWALPWQNSPGNFKSVTAAWFWKALITVDFNSKYLYSKGI